MSYLTQLYSELKLSKQEIYKKYSCVSNVFNFIKHIENKALPKKIFDNLHVIYFYNNNNGYSLYGKKEFSFHLNLLFFDEENSNWYILDYDIENILANYPLDKSILCSEFLQLAFCTESAKSQISIATKEHNYFPLESFQQIMIFTLQEFNVLNQENPNLIHKLRFLSLESQKKEENFLWKLYKDFNISFNNLYELLFFLKEGNSSIDLLRKYYQSKTFEEIFIRGFANAEGRLDKKKLLFLNDFLFESSKSIHRALEESKDETGCSSFFTPLSQKQISESTKNTTPRYTS